MSTPKKGSKKARQVRFYHTDETDRIVTEVLKRMPDMNEQDVVRIHLAAALRATKTNGYKVAFPFEFKIVHPEPERDTQGLLLNERND